MMNEDWGHPSESWRRDLSTIYASADDARSAGAPDAWCALLGREAVARTRAVWEPSAHALPLLHEYLTSQLVDVAIGVGAAGPVLLYRFRDWIDDGDAFLPGVMIAGRPATTAELEQLERRGGALPVGLRTVWAQHGFVQLKNRSILVQPDQARVFATPTHDYLAIVNSWSDMPTCLHRPQGSAWTDDVVVFVPARGTARAGVSPSVDALLVDWATLRWPPDTIGG